MMETFRSERAPRVSVIIPCYNHGRYLAERMETILTQSFTNFEWIFLDDASSDTTREVFEKFRQDGRLAEAVFNKQNSGNLFVQWNRGFRLARGEYIWVAESDDSSERHFLERLVAVLDAHPSVGIAYCQSRMIDEEGKLLYLGTEHTRDIDPQRWERDYMENGRKECDRFLARRNTIPNVSACVMRRSVLESVNYARTDNRFCEDWLLYVRMLQKSDIAFLAEPMNGFRCHAQNTRTRNTRKGEIEEFYGVLGQLQAMGVGTPESIEFLAAHIFARWGILYREAPENFSWSRWMALAWKGWKNDAGFVKRIVSSIRRRMHSHD